MRTMIRCVNGHYRDPEAPFCEECEKLKKEADRCPRCMAPVDRRARYCSNCRSPLHTGQRWMAAGRPVAPAAPVEEFLTSFTIADPERDLTGGIFINEAEEALVLSGGARIDSLQPGRYRPDWFRGRLKSGQPLTVVIVKKGLVDLKFDITGIRTSDPVKIDATLTMAFRIVDSELFFENVAKGKGRCRASEVRDFLEGPVRAAAQDLMAKKSVEELKAEGAAPKERKSLEVLLEHHLAPVLKESGLYLHRLKSVEYDFKGFGGVMEVEEEGFLRGEKDRAETKELEKRITARQRTASLLADLSVSDEKIAEFLFEEEKTKLLRSRELQDIRRALEEREMDHKAKREWILRKLELDQELDYERRRLLGKAGLEREVAEARYAVNEVETKLGKARLEQELEEEKARSAVETQIRERKEEGSLKIMQGLVDLKKRKDRDSAENELFREKEKLELALKQKENEVRLQKELIELFRTASPEAMIAMADRDKVRTLGRFLEVKEVKGYSAEQIIALMSRDRGDLADALTEGMTRLTRDERVSLGEHLTLERERAAHEGDALLTGYFTALEATLDTVLDKGTPNGLEGKWASAKTPLPKTEGAARTGRAVTYLSLRCLSPECKAAFTVKAEGEVSLYRCPKCGGSLIEYA